MRHMLITMRLADMRYVHNRQITRRCERCNETVGVYPSGQQEIKRHPTIEIVCQVCAPPLGEDARPAGSWSEVMSEMRESEERE